LADVLSTGALSALTELLGHEFVEPSSILLALTHRSWCAEHAGENSNERLEFLGDAVLGVVVTDFLFTAHPEMPEGSLAKVRAAVVSEPSLAAVAADLGVGAALRLGKGEDVSGGRTKASILSDALEAIIGAVYIDGGIDAARTLVLSLLSSRIDLAVVEPGEGDYKSALQEFAARELMSAPVYEIVDEGPDHKKRFFARVLIDDSVVGNGEGRSKKGAEQAAAGAALAQLTAMTDTHNESELGDA